MSARTPALEDLYTDAAIRDPHPLYRTIRDLGPAFWLTAHRAWAIGRFADVRAALRADTALVSGRGVAMNEAVNSQTGRVTLTSDGDLNRQLRGVLTTTCCAGSAGSERRSAERLYVAPRAPHPRCARRARGAHRPCRRAP